MLHAALAAVPVHSCPCAALLGRHGSVCCCCCCMGTWHSWGTSLEEQQWALTLFVQPRGKQLGCTSGADAATASYPQPYQIGDHSLWALSPDHNPPSHHFTENFFSLWWNATLREKKATNCISFKKIHSVTISGKLCLASACNIATSLVLQKHKSLLL